MAAATNKKSVSKKGKQLPAKNKSAKSPAKKGPVKSSANAGKAKTMKKAGQMVSSAKKPVAKKPVAKKPVAKKPVAKKPVVMKAGKVMKPHEETVLSRDRLPELRKSLIRKKEGILKEAKEEIAKYISGDNKQLVDTANDEGDWAQVDISEDLSLQRLSAHRKLMHDIDESVRKIGEGTYGICEECGEEISEKRLLVLPTATLCVDCQEQKEQLEEFESSE